MFNYGNNNENDNSFIIISVSKSDEFDDKFVFDEYMRTSATNERSLLKILFNDNEYLFNILEFIDDYIDQYSEEDLFDLIQSSHPMNNVLYKSLYELLMRSSINDIREFLDKLQDVDGNMPPLFFVKTNETNDKFVQFCVDKIVDN